MLGVCVLVAWLIIHPPPYQHTHTQTRHSSCLAALLPAEEVMDEPGGEKWGRCIRICPYEAACTWGWQNAFSYVGQPRALLCSVHMACSHTPRHGHAAIRNLSLVTAGNRNESHCYLTSLPSVTCYQFLLLGCWPAGCQSLNTKKREAAAICSHRSGGALWFFNESSWF